MNKFLLSTAALTLLSAPVFAIAGEADAATENAPAVVAAPDMSPAEKVMAPKTPKALTDVNWLGTYFLGQFGSARTSIEGTLANVDYSETDNQTMAKLGVGIRLSSTVSIEASFVDFGRYMAKTNGQKLRADVHGGTLGAAVRLPFSMIYGGAKEFGNSDSLFDRTALYVRLDAFASTFKGSDNLGKTDTDISPAFAVGIETDISKGFTVRGEYQYIDLKTDSKLLNETTIENISIGFLKSI